MKKCIWLFSIIVLLVTLIILYLPKYFKKNINSYTDINNYNKYLNELIENHDVHSGLSIFPKQINGKVIDFKYLKEDGLFDGSYFFYLVVDYNEENYYKELDRIKNISIEYGSNIKRILYSDIGFNYPTYITIYDGNGSYEYVLFDEVNKKIIYLFNQLFTFSNLDIDLKYLPSDYKVQIKDNKRNGYNIYYNYDEYGNGIYYNEIGDSMNSIKVIIDGKEYTLKLEDNETSKAFLNSLPKEYILEDLNNNEKYVYMGQQLPVNPKVPNKINAGDVMIYGNNCLVIFYKSFNTSYSYTKIGHIDKLTNLGNNISVKFIKQLKGE